MCVKCLPNVVVAANSVRMCFPCLVHIRPLAASSMELASLAVSGCLIFYDEISALYVVRIFGTLVLLSVALRTSAVYLLSLCISFASLG